jgi:hypothetical protein
MKRKMRRASLLFIAFLLVTIGGYPQRKTEPSTKATLAAPDPLPSWNEGASKRAITEFVKNSTDSTSNRFIPVPDRIACFDNDGTLWTEMPLPFQLYFMIDRIKALAPQHPEWKDQQPYKGLLEGDLRSALAGGNKALLDLMIPVFSGLTADEFDKTVKDWMATATHPKTGKHYNEMVYQPMLELLNYLRANGYKTFIVSGGDISFMRVWVEQAYGIPPYQVIGSSFKSKYDTSLAVPAIVKLPEFNFNDDKLGKPVGIFEHIGKRPVFTAGNSDGDYGMLQYTSTSSGQRFGMIVHHTDSAREYAYDRQSSLAKLSKGLDDAAKYHWAVVDMKKDWNKIYPAVQSDIIAIDILLDPGKTMLDSAKAYNKLMQQNYSGTGSYSLDELHRPHITVLQCFVKSTELDKVYAAVGKVVQSEQITNQEITTSGFYYFPYKGLGLAGITVTPSSKLLSFQAKIIEALTPYIVVGTDAAFVQNTNGSAIAAGSSDYVNRFIPDHSGPKYNPHVTIGLAHEDFLKTLIAAPYHPFKFTCPSVSIFHLGDFGTARTKLWTSKNNNQ